MQTTHIPVMDLHTDGTVTPVPTCEACCYRFQRHVLGESPPALKVICVKTRARVGLANTACCLYRPRHLI